MIKLTTVKALEGYKIWIRYSDGIEGTIDLSPLIGHGVFKRLKDPKEFKKVHIDSETGAVTWSPDLDLCPDSLYIQITGKKPEEIFPHLDISQPHA